MNGNYGNDFQKNVVNSHKGHNLSLEKGHFFNCLIVKC